MQERHYSILTVSLAVAALLACSWLWFLMLLVSKLLVKHYEPINDFLWQHAWLLHWGWLPGMILTVSHLLLLRRPHHLVLKILIWAILSLAAFAGLMWILLYDTKVMVLG